MRREHVAEIGSRGRKEPRYVRPLVGRTALRLVRPHRRPPARLPQNSGIADAARMDRSDGRYRAGGGLLRFIRFEMDHRRHTTHRGRSPLGKMNTKLQLSKNVTLNKPDEKRQGIKVRTVVTGHNAKGRAVFVRDEKVDGTPIPGLGELAFLWNADEPATYPNAGNNPAAPGIFPPLGGIRFIIGTYFPGDFIAPEPTPEMHLEDGDELGGANAGFHRTDTTDLGVVLSGNLALQLDDGAEVSLSPGDVLIENGTRHRWRVVGNVPATLASFIIGAQRKE